MGSEPLLRAEGLHTYYGTSHVLHGVDFSIGPGEMVGLLGRNGMGKTTLLRSLVGLTRPRRGAIYLRGVDVSFATPHAIARSGIGFVPEGRGIFANLSVRENLVMAAHPGMDGRREWDLDRVLATFPRLAQRLRHGGAQLSGGEQQMLSIGRALMTNPELIILDEATEGLAPLIRREIWRVIRMIRQDGAAVVVVDKDHGTVNTLADRSMILVKGRAVFSGSTAELRERPDMMLRHLGV
jgi:branched-chain amino acid transport system ATP-binding protein